MTRQPLRIARRVQAAVVGLGIAGALGTAVAVGLGGSAAGTTTDDGWTGQPATTGQQQGDDEGDDDGGGTLPAPGQQSQPGQTQVAPQPATGGSGSHGTSSGS